MTNFAKTNTYSMTDQHHEKYDSTNPIAQKLINQFMTSIDSLLTLTSHDIQSVTECGCGQGHVNRRLEQLYPNARIKGLDISDADLAIANAEKLSSQTELYNKSIYDIGEHEKADLVVCCEVLEHLENPELALQKMSQLNARYYLFSVPREPLWRILNMMRGKYWSDWGNTPDHCNHWSSRGFKKFVNAELTIIASRQPLPWTMILAKPD